MKSPPPPNNNFKQLQQLPRNSIPRLTVIKIFIIHTNFKTLQCNWYCHSNFHTSNTIEKHGTE